MQPIPVTFEYGIAVRRAALTERNVSLSAVLGACESAQPFSENRDLLVFGPHFGGEASNAMVQRLGELGLVYFEDFFDLSFPHPKWLSFHASSNPSPR